MFAFEGASQVQNMGDLFRHEMSCFEVVIDALVLLHYYL